MSACGTARSMPMVENAASSWCDPGGRHSLSAPSQTRTGSMRDVSRMRAPLTRFHAASGRLSSNAGRFAMSILPATMAAM